MWAKKGPLEVRQWAWKMGRNRVQLAWVRIWADYGPRLGLPDLDRCSIGRLGRSWPAIGPCVAHVLFLLDGRTSAVAHGVRSFPASSALRRSPHGQGH